MDTEIKKLFNQYPGDAFAHFYYHYTLWLFRKEGATKKSNLSLKNSIKYNPHIPKYLLGQKIIPKEVPEYMQLGHESEAIAYAQDAKVDWKTTYGALLWLKDYCKSSAI